jgi:hypothetical protein
MRSAADFVDHDRKIKKLLDKKHTGALSLLIVLSEACHREVLPVLSLIKYKVG